MFLLLCFVFVLAGGIPVSRGTIRALGPLEPGESVSQRANAARLGQRVEGQTKIDTDWGRAPV